MSKIYNKEYYGKYCGGSSPYENADIWMPHFERIADGIIKNFNPRTVLDAGCAMGYLVTALRDRNVEAYGIDISDYAISKVREDIRPFCKVGSLAEAFSTEVPQRFDLIVSIEVLEHLTEEDGEKTIKNLCNHADTILFSSTPYDIIEETHINVQPSEYWAKLFYRHQFHNKYSLQPDYITDYAVCFQKMEDPTIIIDEYEKGLKYLQDELEKQKAETAYQLNNALEQVEKTRQQIEKTKEQIEKTREQIERVKDRDAEIIKINHRYDHLNKEYEKCLDTLNILKSELTECTIMKEHWENEFNKIDNSRIWKIIKKFKAVFHKF